MKETDQNKNGSAGNWQEEFVAERETHNPFRTTMFAVKFQQRTGGFLQHCLTISDGLTEERAIEMAVSPSFATHLKN